MREADLEGPRGSAWNVTETTLELARQQKHEESPLLAQWFLTMPGAHPGWQHYLCSVVHLRGIAGREPATIHYPEAAYELMVLALDPAYEPDPDDWRTWRHLVPQNVTVQFHGCDDAWAAQVCELAVRATVNGLLPVEPEGVVGAYQLWADSICETATHQEHPRHGWPHDPTLN